MSTQKHILIAEDDESLGKALVDEFTKDEFRVNLVHNGESCLDYIKKIKPDLLVLDIFMPVLGGVETLKKIRAHKETKDLPVLVLTNFTEVSKVSEMMELGVTDYMVKADSPIEKIVEAVKERLGG